MNASPHSSQPNSSGDMGCVPTQSCNSPSDTEAAQGCMRTGAVLQPTGGVRCCMPATQVVFFLLTYRISPAAQGMRAHSLRGVSISAYATKTTISLPSQRLRRQLPRHG